MLEKLANTFLLRFGYEIRKTRAIRNENSGFTLYKYLKNNGSLDIEKYRQIQIEGNKRKINKVFVIEENIAFLSEYIKTVIGTPQFGICHGTRRGREQEWFRKYLGCEVIGTEISDTAEQFPNTIQWDFHETKAEWLDKTDFIYSNSFDHSYNPEKCLNAWMSCVRVGGLCILEHSSNHGPQKTSDLDPFGADIVHLPYLVLTWGMGRYGLRELFKAPKHADKLKYLYYLIIQRL